MDSNQYKNFQDGAGAVGGFFEILGGIQRARSINSAARQTYRSALRSQANQNVGVNRRYVEEARGLQQTSYDLELQEAAAVAAARNSGAARGIQGITLNSLVAEQRRTGAVNQSRIRDQRENNRVGFLTTSMGIQEQTRNRMEAAPTANFGVLDIGAILAKTAMKIATGA